MKIDQIRIKSSPIRTPGIRNNSQDAIMYGIKANMYGGKIVRNINSQK